MCTCAVMSDSMEPTQQSSAPCSRRVGPGSVRGSVSVGVGVVVVMVVMVVP